MVSSISLADNDESETCVIVLQIGHLLGSNAVQREFRTNSSKVAL